MVRRTFHALNGDFEMLSSGCEAKRVARHVTTRMMWVL